MSEHTGDTSMFDYDVWPVTPQIVLVGDRASSVGYAIRDFLSRNGFPYEWVDVDNRGESTRCSVLMSSTAAVCPSACSRTEHGSRRLRCKESPRVSA